VVFSFYAKLFIIPKENVMINVIKVLIKVFSEKIGIKVYRMKYWMNYNSIFEKHDIKTVVDVGANIGQFAIKVAKKNPKVQIFSFEPIESVFKILSSNTLHFSNVKVFNIGFGERVETMTMFCNEASPSSSMLEMDDTHVELFPHTKNVKETTVNVSTLDSFTFPKDMRGNIFLKIDVQGFEDRVLSGGYQFIEKCEVILIELNHMYLYKNQQPFYYFFSILEEKGFKYMGNIEESYSNDDQIICADAIFIKNHK
jgi:FkbM family methyltransferase